MTNKTIYIVGAGAIGKALAVFLKLNGKEVVLIRGSVDNMPIEKETIRIERAGKVALEATLEVSTLSNFTTLDGIVVLTNKSFGNAELSRRLRRRTGSSPVVLLQNGLGVEQPFVDEGFPEIYRCVLFATSQVISEHTVRFRPVAVSQVGAIKGREGALENIVALLDTGDFPFKAVAGIQEIIWKKAIANSVFNSVCPLLDIDNGIFHRNEAALAVAKRVIRECVTIAHGENIALSEAEVLENLLMISKASDGQLISTLQDIQKKRPTEIGTLNFSIVDIARKQNNVHLVTETNLLGELTKLKSDLNR